MKPAVKSLIVCVKSQKDSSDDKKYSERHSHWQRSPLNSSILCKYIYRSRRIKYASVFLLCADTLRSVLLIVFSSLSTLDNVNVFGGRFIIFTIGD